MRNALDEQLRLHFEAHSGIPWFLLPIANDAKTQERIDRDVQTVRERLRKEHRNKETRGQVIAGLTFGFWAHLLGPKHDQLWKDRLHKAFPNSSGRRSDVSAAVFALQQFRNRVAHHDSLLATDVPFRLTQMQDVLRWIDPDAASWLAAVERVNSVQADRPVARRDTVVVGATDAWPLYQQVHAYVCQPGRSFQPVDYMAFYAGQEIHPEIPGIEARIDNVEWTAAEVNRLRATGDTRDLRVADVIDASAQAGWTAGRYQVFLLTEPGMPNHLTLKQPVPPGPRARQRVHAGSQVRRPRRVAAR
jgi:hypothetical protein